MVIMPLYNFVSSNFVTASGIQMLRGRAFTTQDDTSPDIVALVNQTFVSKFLLGRNPIGVSLRFYRLSSSSSECRPRYPARGRS